MFWDSPQKIRFLVWVGLSWFPSQTVFHRSRSAVLSVHMNRRRAPAAPGGLLPAHIFLFHFLGTMQDCTSFCPVQLLQRFPSRRNLVDLISACNVCRREISFDVSAVWADQLFLCFSFDEILSHGNSSILFCHFFKQPLLWCCIKDSLKIQTIEIEDPFSLHWNLFLSQWLWVTDIVFWKKTWLTQTPNDHIYWCIFQYMLLSKFLPTFLAQRTNFLMCNFLESFYKIGVRFATPYFLDVKADTSDKFPPTQYLTVSCSILWKSQENFLDQLRMKHKTELTLRVAFQIM